jgi:diguanylate cyclase (GGDEF)-like protein
MEIPCPRKNNLNTVVVVTKDMLLCSLVERTLKDVYNLVFFSNIESSLDYIYNSLPHLLVLDVGKGEPSVISMLNQLKSDPIFGQMPALMICDDVYILPAWDDLLVEDFVRKSAIETDLMLRVNLCMARSERVVEVNPLTRLPGNIAITRQITGRLDKGEIFSLSYADLDYFKPFNDKYGFSRGDEVLKMMGRLVLNIVKNRQPVNSFAGHIGGDDFTFIMEPDLAAETALEIMDTFDRIIPTFYDPEDRVRGFIESVDREGNKRTFPIMGISIGSADNVERHFSHYGEFTELVSEMKKYAKDSSGSSFKQDKRR